MSIIKFKNLVYSYLNFVLKDIKCKEILCYECHNFVRIVVKFSVSGVIKGITLCAEYTDDIYVFDNTMLSIANQIKEVIEYERNGKIL